MRDWIRAIKAAEPRRRGRQGTSGASCSIVGYRSQATGHIHRPFSAGTYNGQMTAPRAAFPLGLVAASALALVALGGVASATKSPPPSKLAPIHGKYAPKIDPANFVARIDNRFLPFKPGTRFHYEGVRGRTPQTDDEVVTHRTERILGVKATAVRDTVSEHGRAVERTDDFYAQDRQGNVWYMGEDSFELRNGRFVKASDSWKSGIKGAKPGIIMPAHPRPGDAYRQEYFPPGKALDEAHVLRLDGSLTVPFGSFTDVLVTSEFSPAEPQTERKYYARGVGEIAERVVKGHHEEFKLVGVSRH
jgi:hypothetical protein